jgi:hypothetical protein
MDADINKSIGIGHLYSKGACIIYKDSVQLYHQAFLKLDFMLLVATTVSLKIRGEKHFRFYGRNGVRFVQERRTCKRKY